MSCHKPNLQQIPKEQEWRDLFIAPEGYKMITADYSQIELRILAEFSKDPKFIEAYKMREDLHQRVADSLRISRGVAKTVNFGIIYGMGPSGLSRQLGIKTAEAEKIINAYFVAYPKVRRTLEELEVKPLVNGFTVTPLGRKRFFGDVSNMKEHSAMKRKGRNTPIQSTCGDILKKAIHLLYESLGAMEAGIINVIHDEILIECKNEDVEEAAGIIRNCMVQAGEEFIKAVPVEVNIMVDQRWKK
jgi:DNA polymerase-1